MQIGTLPSATIATRQVNGQAGSAQVPAHTPPAKASVSQADSVTLSEAGRQAAARESTAAPFMPAGTSSGDYPVEMYRMPNWMAGSSIQVANTLGASGNWQAERYPQFAAASAAEHKEYAGLLHSTYQALLKDNGIQSVDDHYRALILDRASSESLRVQMQERVAANPRLLELMGKLGLGIG